MLSYFLLKLFQWNIHGGVRVLSYDLFDLEYCSAEVERAAFCLAFLSVNLTAAICPTFNFIFFLTMLWDDLEILQPFGFLWTCAILKWCHFMHFTSDSFLGTRAHVCGCFSGCTRFFLLNIGYIDSFFTDNFSCSSKGRKQLFPTSGFDSISGKNIQKFCMNKCNHFIFTVF